MTNDLQSQKAALGQIWDEVKRAKGLHGSDFRSIHEGYAILIEEVDELWDEVKFNPKKGMTSPSDIFDACTAHRLRMRKEAIQVAAMALRFAAELT